jgi:hypothetical protein
MTLFATIFLSGSQSKTGLLYQKYNGLLFCCVLLSSFPILGNLPKMEPSTLPVVNVAQSSQSGDSSPSLLSNILFNNKILLGEIPKTTKLESLRF